MALAARCLSASFLEKSKQMLQFIKQVCACKDVPFASLFSEDIYGKPELDEDIADPSEELHDTIRDSVHILGANMPSLQ